MLFFWGVPHYDYSMMGSTLQGPYSMVLTIVIMASIGMASTPRGIQVLPHPLLALHSAPGAQLRCLIKPKGSKVPI